MIFARSTLNAERRGVSVRGTAEVELLLVTGFILIPMLLLTGGMLVLGPTRILNVFQSNEQAYQDATTSATPGSVPNVDVQDSGIQLVDPGDSDVPAHLDELQQANRVHQATTKQDVTVKLGAGMSLPTVTLTNTAEFSSPAWAYSCWPAGGDSALEQQWVESYASESTDQYQDALLLQPPWPP